MNWLESLILGIIQGLAEYLPISSSGHLEIIRNLLGIELSGADSLEFDVMLHVATVLSTIIILWKEFAPLCISFFSFRRDENTTYVWKILLSCIPVAIVGILFKDFVESFFGEGLLVVGICLLITAALLVFAYIFRTRPVFTSYKKHSHRITWLDAFVMGVAQAVAVLPGLSRSGTTIATGILMGAKREDVAKFSFLMVIIPILGEAILDTVKLLHEASAGEITNPIGWHAMIVGFVAALLVGCAACKWMLEIVRKGRLVWFAIYCAAVGILCIVL